MKGLMPKVNALWNLYLRTLRIGCHSLLSIFFGKLFSPLLPFHTASTSFFSSTKLFPISPPTKKCAKKALLPLLTPPSSSSEEKVEKEKEGKGKEMDASGKRSRRGRQEKETENRKAKGRIETKGQNENGEESEEDRWELVLGLVGGVLRVVKEVKNNSSNYGKEVVGLLNQMSLRNLNEVFFFFFHSLIV